MMKHGMSACSLVLTVWLAVFLAGCNDGANEVKTVDVSGAVTLDGEPLENVSITFSSTTRHAGIGVTDGSGHYTLRSGAEPGENKVYFKEVGSVEEEDSDEADDGMDDDGSEDDGSDDDEDGGQVQSDGGSVLPGKYTSPETSGVTFTVPPDGTDSADFALTSD